MLAGVFLVPWLVMHFFIKDKFKALWEVKEAFYKVFDNATEYIIAYFKTLIFVLIYFNHLTLF